MASLFLTARERPPLMHLVGASRRTFPVGAIPVWVDAWASRTWSTDQSPQHHYHALRAPRISCQRRFESNRGLSEPLESGLAIWTAWIRPCWRLSKIAAGLSFPMRQSAESSLCVSVLWIFGHQPPTWKQCRDSWWNWVARSTPRCRAQSTWSKNGYQHELMSASIANKRHSRWSAALSSAGPQYQRHRRRIAARRELSSNGLTFISQSIFSTIYAHGYGIQNGPTKCLAKGGNRVQTSIGQSSNSIPGPFVTD